MQGLLRMQPILSRSLFLPPPLERSNSSVYTATIGAEFLDRLDGPSQPLHSHCVSVKYSCILSSPAQDVLKQLHRLICISSCSLCAGVQPQIPASRSKAISYC
ncbi:hypothetical protein BDW42DRAFT_179771 [Aspergillus taichungensis]|uniref:Uncharacterized protein n=1 Tax=Aspergillus taichungensis TaxID=482145 RepID=A0A2J5HG85_9EURO|nr:hypothetical protein BDW42DRAFT_179771 [Aspergillus taichungensis]